ncbi:MAG TPA: DHA2 family efflux MFS transporter permease subunit [Bryobacteraceae bacterium]|nr:DHA2 family efflux MFS transporter permease subunit [Bryobacteraceae bacterium]
MRAKNQTTDPAAEAQPKASPAFLLWLVAIAFFMESLDTTILNTAVPAIAGALHVSPLSLKSVLASYMLSLAVFIPISGWMADRFGTRTVFSSAIAVFTLGSLLCGLSTNLPMLVVFRILQGCGGAMMVPVGRLIVVRAFPKSGLLQAMSFVGIPALIGPLLGPLAGGALVHYAHWRVIFFINIPIGLLGLALVYRYLPEYRQELRTQLDAVGLVLFGGGIALMSYVLEVFGEHTLSMTEIWCLLGLSVLLLGAYGSHAKRTEAPLLNASLFSVRTFRSAVSGSFLTRLGAGGVAFLLPMLYQVGMGLTPVQSGLLLMPQALMAMGLKVVVQKILARYSFRTVLSVNTVALGVMIMLFATISKSTSLGVVLTLSCMFGSLSSLQYSSLNSLVYSDIPPESSGGASSIASTAQQLSLSFGIALASLLAATFVPRGMAATPAEIVEGVHRAFLVMGGLTILSVVSFFSLRKADGASTMGLTAE